MWSSYVSESFLNSQQHFSEDKEELFQNVLTQVAEQFSRAFKINELKSEVTNRLAMLEKRVELEGMKVVEIEKCRTDIKKLRVEMASRNNSNFLEDTKKLTPRRDVPSYPKYMLSEQTIEALKKPAFDVWLWEANEMLSCLEHMYHDLGLVTDFNINPITLKRWLLSIHDNYKNNPFHNFRHCFCVTQMMYSMICLCSLQGTITLILATDMARHGEILDSFKQKVDSFDFTDEEHATCLKMVLIKCCDISNEVRPMEVAEPWVDCLLEEYFMQSDREKTEGLPVAPFMDRERVTKPTAQIGFIKFVLIPMFESVMKVNIQDSDDNAKNMEIAQTRRNCNNVTDTWTLCVCVCVYQLFPQIEEAMVQPLRESRDRYEELKQIDDAMNEVGGLL
ncbi:hypothetical protein F2P81_020736 [Scophthalmus maximus]|uniref:PDEase domain-containing protein n=1 Tax=Scophthalmus maximus TaxID=52904 RepID=A0A6A4S0E8_SCOMX|nr:hypothetical protein F2P81_020736 [Scophthalmus maximus]